MDLRVILALGLAVACGLEADVDGCSSSQSPSLSLSLSSGRKAHSSLQCLIRKAPSQSNFTFILYKNEKVVRFSQVIGHKMWYPLDAKKNNSGRWRCEVQELPDLCAEYYLETPTTAPPVDEEKDTATSPPASTMSTRILLTILTVALLLMIFITVISVTSGVCVMQQCRRTSPSRQHHKDRTTLLSQKTSALT
ncbi:uncharacterized protein [Dendropsophus ebraccatus]|uniref:uncharacterized protein isoform X2 n=1 Tax=Dendropsophus ebraccatus TaxID=150705 RepID=UPI0038315C8D